MSSKEERNKLRLKELDELIEKRKLLRNEISLLSKRINQIKRTMHNQSRYIPHKSTDTIVYKTFGKSCSELTYEEKKEYNRIKQRECRERKAKLNRGVK